MIKKVNHDDMMKSIRQAVDGPAATRTDLADPATVTGNRRELVFNQPPADTGLSVEEMVRREEEQASAGSAFKASAAAPSGVQSGLGLMRVPLSHIIKNPKYQNRLRLSEDHIESLRLQFRASKQQEAIKVRRVGERFELLKGHHRVEAATREGWEDIESIVVEMDDRAARLEAMLSNAGRLDETDYERALTFRSLLDKNSGYFKTQAQVGEAFGLTQGAVSKILSMLELPGPILAILEKHPGIISANTARQITEIAAEYPEQIEIIVNGVTRILDGNEESSIRAWILQAIQHAKGAQNPAKPAPKIVPDLRGAPLYSVRSPKPNQVVIDIKGDVPAGEVEALIYEALSKRVQDPQSPQ